jgi:hypothetical protein
MPISRFLNGRHLDPETRRLVGVAFEIARAAVRYAGRTDLTDEAIAARIIKLAKAGERDPNVLCEAALNAGPVSAPNPPRPPDAQSGHSLRRSRTTKASKD